ncbi:MAG: ribosome assembly cofactor RimP [Bacteroidales bacterium]|nr:ribosome assembly cofactor RimP [Bacteroidales bacterium]
MIEKIKVLELINGALDGSDKFLVSLKITPDNRIFVDIDGDNGVNIDDCIELSRSIESQLDRDEEDFELNVGSAGADMPLKLPRQYRRHIGRDLDVTTFDGEHLEAELIDADDEGISLRTHATKKTPAEDSRLKYSDIKVAKVVIKF